MVLSFLGGFHHVFTVLDRLLHNPSSEEADPRFEEQWRSCKALLLKIVNFFLILALSSTKPVVKSLLVRLIPQDCAKEVNESIWGFQLLFCVALFVRDLLAFLIVYWFFAFFASFLSFVYPLLYY